MTESSKSLPHTSAVRHVYVHAVCSPPVVGFRLSAHRRRPLSCDGHVALPNHAVRGQTRREGNVAGVPAGRASRLRMKDLAGPPAGGAHVHWRRRPWASGSRVFHTGDRGVAGAARGSGASRALCSVTPCPHPPHGDLEVPSWMPDPRLLSAAGVKGSVTPGPGACQGEVAGHLGPRGRVVSLGFSSVLRLRLRAPAAPDPSGQAWLLTLASRYLDLSRTFYLESK